MIYTALGRDFTLVKHFPPSTEDRVHMVQFLEKMPALVSAGAVRPNPVTVRPGGLAAIPEGLKFMKEGGNSGEKIVYRVS